MSYDQSVKCKILITAQNEENKISPLVVRVGSSRL